MQPPALPTNPILPSNRGKDLTADLVIRIDVNSTICSVAPSLPGDYRAHFTPCRSAVRSFPRLEGRRSLVGRAGACVRRLPAPDLHDRSGEGTGA